jgi:phosphate transport system substrate-binding protein
MTADPLVRIFLSCTAARAAFRQRARTRALLAVVLCLLSALAQAQPLRIHGSNTVGERLMPALVEAWLSEQGHSGLRREPQALDELLIHATDGVSVQLHSHGSSTGFADLASMRADLAMSSRPITEAERAQLGEVREVVIALDGLAVIVHPSNPLRQIELRDLRRVFAGEVSDWSQLGRSAGRIALHARDDRSGTYDTFRSLVLGSAPLSLRALRYESTEALAAAVARDPNAIGFVGLAGVKGVRALAVADGAQPREPSAREVAVEDYALARRLFLYAPAREDARLESLLAFVLSDAGQRIVEGTGFVSQRVQAFAPELAADAPASYRQLVQGARRLSLNLRFDEGSIAPDSKALADLERLAEFMRQPAQQGRFLLLVGFADAGEVTPLQAEVLSNDRADQVADRMEALGLRPRSVRGLGGQLLLSADDSPRGRARNRRVEVWLR